MKQEERDNWVKIKKALEEAGKTDCYFYNRSVAIAEGGDDIMESKWD